ncbi:VWA domain-containing protein [Methylocystis heyeri]|uniref:VWA domain-containing protein n=1 Tax=Methylocystis heyeri TaxID=391905 RepID=A0A6B8KBA1_9HYPH|nr:VWA domain-containing protein [Methylocystis heyeri]QGM44947.1 VWA domain-containing protein [Methylocystis heyeri]
MNDRPDNRPLARSGSDAAIDAFLNEAKALTQASAGGRGRLIFALDATMSRQPTWDLAQSIQGEMFSATAEQGGLEVQLAYYRGFMECRASSFVSGGRGLAALMSRISCQGGRTQIGRLLRHVRDESRARPVAAFVFIGDAMEENVDDLAGVAGELGLLGVKAFMFQEGGNPAARLAFREIARVTGGAYAAFDANAPRRLAELLKAAAAYAAGGRLQLEKMAESGEAAARLLLSQM